jgi:hypothetical protein
MRQTAAILIAILTVASCRHVEQIEVDAGPWDAYGEGTPLTYGSFEGVDLLVVVDNSASMSEEQQVLATAFFPLINALVDPLPGWPFPAVDDMRVAMVSSDMGLSWGGNPYEPGDGWPGDTPYGCSSIGDNGEFETYVSGKAINLMHATIPCDESASQCPTGWSCEEIGGENDVGTCWAPGGDGTSQTCPDMSASWLETPLGLPEDPVPNAELAFQVSCLSVLGTSGCGFEQQLQAAAVALHEESQTEFVRDGALLAVIQVSDEEDCSIESNGLFSVPEIQNLADGKVNVACAKHPQYLYEPGDFYDAILQAKNGVPGSAVFAAIVGVPIDDACQGGGHEIPDCLDHPDMDLTEVQENDATFIEPACLRYAGDQLVTKGRPGRRFVELAQSFGPGGYVFSICNEDWLPAAEDVAELIATRLEGSCFPEQLPWDADQQVSSCHLFVQYSGAIACPVPTDPAADPILEGTELWCPLPRIPAPLACDEVEASGFGAGWYYCENTVTDDDDPCQYNPQTTTAAQELIQGRQAEIRCPLAL